MQRPFLLLVSCLAVFDLGCSDDCDCPLGGTCEPDGTCAFECTADADCPAFECADEDACCDDLPTCTAHACQRRIVEADACGAPPEVTEDNDGWSDPVGAGEAYVVAAVAVNPACDGCDNAFAGLEEIFDRHFDGQILGGRTRLLVEVLGRDNPGARFDRSLTVALYPGRDYDDPVNVYNDFAPLPDTSACCEFYPAELTPGPESPTGLRAPAQLVRGHLATTAPVQKVVLPYFLTNDVRALLRLHEVTVTGRAAASGAFTTMNLRGRLLPADLWKMQSEYCIGVPEGPRCPRSMPEGSRVLDLIFAAAGPPDRDRDGDGLECLLDLDDDGLVDTCCDGADVCSPSCSPIPPVHSSVPSSCALDPRIQDGWDVTISAQLVPATVYPAP